MLKYHVVCVLVPPNVFQNDWQIFIKLGLEVMPLQAFPPSYFLNYLLSVIPY
jgi:hypothetical protein